MRKFISFILAFMAPLALSQSLGNYTRYPSQTSGTVTSITAGTGLTGGTITSSGTIALFRPVATTNGGTGTTTAFTPGSVVFAGSSGIYTQNNADFFWDNTNNRLGILTATPAQSLEVNGTTKVDTGLIVPLIYPISDSTTAIQIDKANGTSNIVNIDTMNSRVGIETTAPAQALEVNGTTKIDTGLIVPLIYPASDSTSAIQIDKANGTSNVIDVDTTNSRVGIGTITPAQALEVNGTTKIDTGLIVPLIYPLADSTTAIQIDKANGTSNVIDVDTTNSRVGIGTITPAQALEVNGTTQIDTGLIIPLIYPSTDSTTAIQIDKANGTSNIVNIDTTNSRVGIGTTSPANKLDVNGSAAFGTYAGTAAASNNVIVGGSVGIGLTNPSVTMEIYNNTTGTQLRVDGDGQNGGILLYSFGTGVRPSLSGRLARGSYAIPSAAQSGDVLMRFGGAGYGTSAFPLINNASIDFDAAQNFSSSAQGTYIALSTTPDNSTSLTERMRVDQSGNIGIGTTLPHSSLEVNGGMQLNTSTAQPSCTSSIRGALWVTESASGTTDNLAVCLKSAANTYSWIQIVTGG